MKKIYGLLATSLLLAGTAHSYAGSWQVGIVADGGALSMHSNTKRLTLAAGLSNSYTNKSTQSLVLGGGVHADYGMMVNNGLQALIGLRAEYLRTPIQATHGVVHPLVNQANNFDVLNYNYKMQSYLVLSNLEWLWKTPSSPLHPYLSMGAGVVWNNLFDYTETTPSYSTAAPMLTPFRNHTRPQFAYGVGIGFQRCKKHVALQFGYEFLALGRAQLGTTSVQSTTDALRTKPIYLHLFEMSFNII